MILKDKKILITNLTEKAFMPLAIENELLHQRLLLSVRVRWYFQ